MKRIKTLVSAAALFAMLGAASTADAQGLGFLRNHAHVSQAGSGNGAAIAQNGAANDARIGQNGANQGATVHQDGVANTGIIGQAGRNNTGSISQTGNGNAACLVQAGRNLDGSIAQAGDNQSLGVLQTPLGARQVSTRLCTAVAAGLLFRGR